MKMGMKRHRLSRNAVWGVLGCTFFVLFTARVWALAGQEPARPPVSGEITLNMDPEHSKLSWTLGSTLHTVHGKFALKSGRLSFDPAGGSATGEFIAYATSGE